MFRSMLGRSKDSRSTIDRRLALLAVLSLLTMPQNYRGGAEEAHAHAIFQFWFTGDHASADHHHGDDVPKHEHEEEPAHQPEASGSSRLVDNPDVPTISEATPSSERADAVGGLVTSWSIPLLFVTLAVVWVSRPLIGRAFGPEPPPPRSHPTALFN